MSQRPNIGPSNVPELYMSMGEVPSVKQCRVCSCELFEKPIIRFENLPKVAQFFPDAGSLDSDRGTDLAVFQCAGCGLVQTDNEPVHYYKEVVRSAAISKEMTAFRKSQFGDFLDKYSIHRKKVLEVGCGCGEYLHIMNQFDVDAYGLEYSGESVKKCRQKGLNVIQGFVDSENYLLRDAPFDAFYMLNFLEHLPGPGFVLRGISNNLTTEGIGIIEVPNFEMMLRKNLFSEFTTDHLFYFTQETIKTVLNLNGFEVLECGTFWHDYILSAVVRKRKIVDMSKFQSNKDHVQQDIVEYISRFRTNQVAIWGAGHQALAVMSLMNLSGKIKYVVDSAAFKQNKLTPASHIPIVAPDKLISDPVDAVIIMAAGYSDEVAGILRTMNVKVNVSILRDFGLEEK